MTVKEHKEALSGYPEDHQVFIHVPQDQAIASLKNDIDNLWEYTINGEDEDGFAGCVALIPSKPIA